MENDPREGIPRDMLNCFPWRTSQDADFPGTYVYFQKGLVIVGFMSRSGGGE